MGIIGHIKRKGEDRERVYMEYRGLYSRCFEGSPDEVELKLDRWDQVHRATRYWR